MNKDRSHSMEKFLLRLFIAFMVVIFIVTILASIFIGRIREIFHSNIHERMKEVASLASKTIVNADDLDRFYTMEDIDVSAEFEDEETEKIVRENAAVYEGMLEAMREFVSEHGLVYVYFMRDVGNGREQIILDSDESEERLDLSYVEDMDEITAQVFATGEIGHMELGNYNPEYMGIIAAYAPVYNSNGKLVAIVGIDIYDENILFASKMTAAMTWVFMGCAILLIMSSASLLFLYGRKAKAYRDASVAKSEFLSRMSHEIRTPMNAIIGFTRMAQKAESIEEVKPNLKRINDSSAFLLQLINSILDISKIEAGKMHLSVSASSPLGIMDNIYNMMKAQAVLKNITFTVNSEGDIPRYIYCDNTYLTQIIVNLLSNALKFTAENGKVAATMKLLDKTESRVRLEFTVTDTGIGIKKDYLDKVFDAFEQVDGGITRKFGGTGLGLNISKLLVGLFGGNLCVESTEGKGSRFWFDAWFNVVNKEDEPSESFAVSEEEKSVNLTDKKVLIFEDNEINQIIAGNALEELGATVEFAENGRIGYKKYIDEPNKYYIIFMDIQMPEMDGYEATKLIRNSGLENAKTIPIIAMSANVFKEDINASLAAGMNAHIGKPFDIAQVVSAIYDSVERTGKD